MTNTMPPLKPSDRESHVLVKHLLIPREQLTPFDINFSQLRRKLDFTSTRQALARFFGSPGSTVRGVFRWSKDNALLELAKAGLPLVDEHLVDAKHDLEDALKKACMRFIGQAASDLAEPVLEFVSKVKAFTGGGGQLWGGLPRPREQRRCQEAEGTGTLSHAPQHCTATRTLLPD